MGELYREAGLEQVAVEARAPIYPGGPGPPDAAADRGVGMADVIESDEIDREVREHFADPDTVVMSGLMFLAQG